MNMFARNHSWQSPDWRLLRDEQFEPAYNLACEEAISRSQSQAPTLRLWRNSRCVVLGRCQILEAEVDLQACLREQVPVLRRFSGGGAVYNDLGNLNISVFLPLHVLKGQVAKVPEMFRHVLEPLALVLVELGVDAEVQSRGLFVHHRKISGVAAWVGVNGILVHASLLFSADLDLLTAVLNGPGAAGEPRWERTRSHRAPVTSLIREVGYGITIEKLYHAIASGFEQHFNATLKPTELMSEENDLANNLLVSRYGRRDWHQHGLITGLAAKQHFIPALSTALMNHVPLHCAEALFHQQSGS